MKRISKEESRRAIAESRKIARQRDELIRQQNATMQARNEQAVADMPVRWYVRLRFQKKGIKRWEVLQYQGNYEVAAHQVSYTWDSRPTEDPDIREYSNQAWSCGCGEPGCIHILKAKEYAKAHRKPSESAVMAAERREDYLSPAQLDWLGRIWGSDPRFRAENGRLLTFQGRPATKASDCVFDGEEKIFLKKLLEPRCWDCAQHGCERRKKHSVGVLGCEYVPSGLPAYAKTLEEAAKGLPFGSEESRAVFRLLDRVERRMRA